MDTSRFLAKLNTVNWVEEKYEREQAIFNGAKRFWDNLCAELKGCTDSYNNRYGTDPSQPIVCDAANGSVKIRKPTRPGDPRHRFFAEEATVDVSLNYTGRPSIIFTQLTPKPGQPGTMTTPDRLTREFFLDTDATGVVFMGLPQIGILDPREASRTILEHFLFG